MSRQARPSPGRRRTRFRAGRRSPAPGPIAVVLRARIAALAALAVLAPIVGCARSQQPSAAAQGAPASTAPGMAARMPLAGGPATADGTAVRPVERRLAMMGTWLGLAVEAPDRESALAASERAVGAIAAAEARLSTWRGDSELSRLNRTPTGRPLRLSAHLAVELALVRRWWAATDGAFDPAIGPLVFAWGLRSGGRIPSPAERAAATAASDMAGLRLGPGAVATRLRGDLLLEEGAWGKGAGLADALAALAATRASRASLDLGGQVAVWQRPATPQEPPDAARPWQIPVADPRRRDRPVVVLSITHGSLSTSGNSEHGLAVGGRRIGHILDPRSGQPADDFGSLTVWTADPLAADCLSTGLFVLGPERALAWAGRHPGVEVLALRPAGRRLLALASPGLRGRLRPLTSDVEISFGETGLRQDATGQRS